MTLLRFSWIAAVLFVPMPVRADPTDERPNIVLIMADDVGSECFGCYGSEQYATPHIDRLARQGLRFTHCYSQPLCTPSRVKLMTGLSNVRNYSGFSVLNRDQRTIGQYLKEVGYKTAVAGKWQLLGAEHYSPRFREQGTWPRQAGFDRMCLWQVDRLGSRYWEPLLYVDGKNRQYGPERYGPDVATEFLTDFMATHQDEPFFAYYPMILGHSPFKLTPTSGSRQNRSRRQNFQDMVTHIDTLVGRIVDQAEELGIAPRTLILVTTDNGTHKSIRSKLDGQTIRGGKGKTTDAGTRVPLVAYWPGEISSGGVCDDLVDFSDFLPTLLEVAGAPPVDGLDGRSFLPQLRGQPDDPRRWIYSYYNPRPEKTEPVRWVQDKRWKLYGDERFYEVAADPKEKHRLETSQLGAAGKRAHQKLTTALDSMPAEGQQLLKFGADSD